MWLLFVHLASKFFQLDFNANTRVCLKQVRKARDNLLVDKNVFVVFKTYELISWLRDIGIFTYGVK